MDSGSPPARFTDSVGADRRFAFSLTPAAVAEFRTILDEECSEKVSEEEAWGRAIEALSFFRLMLERLPAEPPRPMPREFDSNLTS